jgi:hypothetical protein
MKVQQLIDRMKKFGQPDSLPFDGYPSMECTDENLIHEALAEHRNGDATLSPCVVAFMCYLASCEVTTRAEYDACRAFIEDYVDTCWACNMTEGSNPVQHEIDEAS